MKKYILALDQGTSSSRAIVFDRDGRICSVAQKEFPQHFPEPGRVEHNPLDIWSSEASVIAEAITSMGINGLDIAAIGITNQRETTIVWDAETGEPVHNAIVWQDRRTSAYCDSLKDEGLTDFIRSKTGLIIDAYFSATKIRWILENVPGAREKAEAEANAKKLEGVQVVVRARAGSAGKLFGAVTSQEICDALKAQHGIDIEKNKIVQADPIKTFGSYTVKAKLGYEVSGTVNVLVIEDK